MSVILECQAGDEIVSIVEFHASPDGKGFCWDTSRRFHVGERVRFVGARQHANSRDRPNGWLIEFESTDGKHYAATQAYFVTEECWHGIERYFSGAKLLAQGEGSTMLEPSAE